MANKEQPKRAHKATYASDKREGGYNIRIEGPHAGKFANRMVPVTRLNGTESVEKLTKLIWQGVDEKSKNPVALYKFEQRPREAEPEFDF